MRNVNARPRAENAQLREAERFGRELAETDYRRIREEGMSGADATSAFGEEVDGLKRELQNHMRPEELADWLDAARAAYRARINELSATLPRARTLSIVRAAAGRAR
jgi:hypothetical protein